MIGPNGTGKSSIVCGIALGLGFSPKVLGRAPDVSSFIMTGQTEAFVELELEGRTEGRTVVINRSFKKGKGSIWHLNGKTASVQQVADTVSGLGIQVDNLCCFLPQDKVASFAAMSPKELLKATMKAANEVRLPEWHEVLVNAENKLSDLTTVSESYFLTWRSRRKLMDGALGSAGPGFEPGEVGEDQRKDRRVGRDRTGVQRTEKSRRKGKWS